MSFTDKHIVDAYSDLFEGLNNVSKLELIERLTRSLKTEEKKKQTRFFKSFGAFASEKTAEEIVADIKGSRKFRRKDIKL